MPSFEHGDASIYYEEYGAGFPLLLFAPGGMHSMIKFWHESAFDPTVEFASDFRVIAMDQRNAGQSHGPIRAGDNWRTYASDQLALLDHLGIQSTHIMGGCIGSSYCLGLIQAAGERAGQQYHYGSGLKSKMDMRKETARVIPFGIARAAMHSCHTLRRLACMP